MRVVVVLALASCAYQPGSFRSDLQPFAGQRTTAGCIDLTIDRQPDLPHGDVVLTYAFGNRCDRPAIVDLAAVMVIGRAPDGTVRPLRVYDPQSEVELRWLDGRAVGSEALAYRSDTPLAEVCVEAGTIAHAPVTQWMCFASQSLRQEVP